MSWKETLHERTMDAVVKQTELDRTVAESWWANHVTEVTECCEVAADCGEFAAELRVTAALSAAKAIVKIIEDRMQIRVHVSGDCGGECLIEMRWD